MSSQQFVCQECGGTSFAKNDATSSAVCQDCGMLSQDFRDESNASAAVATVRRTKGPAQQSSIAEAILEEATIITGTQEKVPNLPVHEAYHTFFIIATRLHGKALCDLIAPKLQTSVDAFLQRCWHQLFQITASHPQRLHKVTGADQYFKITSKPSPQVCITLIYLTCRWFSLPVTALDLVEWGLQVEKAKQKPLPFARSTPTHCLHFFATRCSCCLLAATPVTARSLCYQAHLIMHLHLNLSLHPNCLRHEVMQRFLCALQGKLPLFNILEVVPQALVDQLAIIDRKKWLLTHTPGYTHIVRTALLLADLFCIDLPPLNINGLLSQALEKVQLPAVLYPLVSSLCTFAEPTSFSRVRLFSPVHHAIAVPYIVVALKLVYGLDDAPRANSVERVDQFVKLGVEPLPFWLKRLATLIDRDSTKRASSFASRQLCRDYMKSKSTPSYALPKLVAMVSDLFASVDQPTPPPSPAAANPEGSKSETTPSVEWADTHPELLALQAEYWHTHFLQQPLRLCVYGHADGSEADEVSSIGLPETVHEEYRYVIEALAILFRCPVNRLHMATEAVVKRVCGQDVGDLMDEHYMGQTDGSDGLQDEADSEQLMSSEESDDLGMEMARVGHNEMDDGRDGVANDGGDGDIDDDDIEEIVADDEEEQDGAEEGRSDGFLTQASVGQSTPVLRQELQTDVAASDAT
eukprot:m.209802 g.209802  ORF g.209802 m.209802 type:complete len:693 (+) comp15048_c0_seq16:135-2213(+)